MEEKPAVQSEFSYLDSFLKELHAQDPAVLLGLVVAVIVVLFTIGELRQKPRCFSAAQLVVTCKLL